MRANVKKTIQAFCRSERYIGGTNKDGRPTVWTDGDTIFSYAMPIATTIRGCGAVLLVNWDDAPTQTTKQHLSGVNQEFHRAPSVCLDDLKDYMNHQDAEVRRCMHCECRFFVTGPDSDTWLCDHCNVPGVREAKRVGDAIDIRHAALPPICEHCRQDLSPSRDYKKGVPKFEIPGTGTVCYHCNKAHEEHADPAYGRSYFAMRVPTFDLEGVRVLETFEPAEEEEMLVLSKVISEFS